MLLLTSLLDPPNLPRAAVGESSISSCQVLQFSTAPASLHLLQEQWDPATGDECLEHSASCILKLPADPSTLLLKAKLVLQVWRLALQLHTEELTDGVLSSLQNLHQVFLKFKALWWAFFGLIPGNLCRGGGIVQNDAERDQVLHKTICSLSGRKEAEGEKELSVP